MSPVSPENLAKRSLADLVIEDRRAAAVFERFELDYCCHGDQTISEAAEARGTPVAQIAEALAALGAPPANARSTGSSGLEEIVDDVRAWHRRYREVTSGLAQSLRDLIAREGNRYAALADVERAFIDLQEKLASHLAKEESILLPFIDDLAAALRTGTPVPPLGSILHPVRFMEAEHRQINDLVHRLRAATEGYRVPDAAPAAVHACYQELASLAMDLHGHLHLENNVLFPKVVALASQPA
jgi:regulator of cell morphogenesis and NO signaling